MQGRIPISGVVSKSSHASLLHWSWGSNVTPDSFSDGGRFVDVNAAVSHALKMVENGAHLIDVGGESTRPGADAVSTAVELERTVPVIRALSAHSGVPISIDTTKASVARAAIEAGATIINDVSAMTQDPDMVDVAAECDAGIVLMHMRGKPKDMQSGDLSDPNITETVVNYLRERMDALNNAGVSADRIASIPVLVSERLLNKTSRLFHH